MNTIERLELNVKFKEPRLVAFCQVIGGLASGIGALLAVVSLGTVFDPSVSGQGEALAYGIALLLSGLLWFAIAEIIRLLAQIAHNTNP